MRLLFLTPQLPFPATQGAAIRNRHLIAGLALDHEVALLTFAPPGCPGGIWAGPAVPSLPGAPVLAALGLVPPPVRTPRDRVQTLLRSRLPDMARRLATPALAAALRQMQAAAAYDYVIVEGIEMAPYRHALGGRWLFDAHNAEYLLQHRTFLSDLRAAYQPRAAAGAAYSLVQWRRLCRYERAVCRAATRITAVSAADRAALQRLDPRLEVAVVPNGVDLAEWSPAAIPADPAVTALQAAGPLLVFDGSMDFRPNVDAVRWFCRACWPAIRRAHPTATFAIVGRHPAPAVQALGALPGVRVTGAVADPRPWVAAATVYVVPMRIGGGVRLKFLQALALGRPIVSTTLGAEGVAVCAGRDLILADTPAAFAAAVNGLLADPARRATLGPAARQAAAPYAWSQIIPRFAAVLGEGSGVRGQGSGLSTQDLPLRTSLIMTVRDEAGSIDRVLASLRAQSQPPDEVVIVDGGSRDGTVERIAAAAAAAPWPLRLLVRPGANISQGRNAAIAAAHYPLIAVTDAGVSLPDGWLAALLAPFAGPDAAAIDVVSGFFAPDPQTVFERALGATVLPVVEDIDPARFLPSSRSVAFRKTAWQAAGGYPEWLDYSEDLVFDLALQRQGSRFVFAPRAVVLFRPRGSLRAFYRQYYLYARGDGKADLWRRRHAIRYATYLLALPLLGGARRWPALGLLLLGGALAYCAGPYRRLRPWLAGLSPAAQVQAVALVPLIRLTGDCGKMIGYPVGVGWRLRRRGRPAIRP
ncbi:MAG TPA: glycosyltransferase [Chloroflexia bacterium]|nr:glycosyltransferase [Chloroflexia bacterium]